MSKTLASLALLLVSFNAGADVLYVPKSLSAARAPDLLVMLHGCKTTAAEFAIGTRMNDLAEKYGFIVFYPEQEPASNSDRCWNWFYNFNQARGHGEPGVIMNNVSVIKTRYKVARTYIAGMSSGGAMAAILASTYADQINGVAIHSGLSYMAAFTVEQANWALMNGSITPAVTSATAAYQNSLFPARQMPVLTFQGDADTRVYPRNVEDVMNHFALFNDLVDDRQMNGSFAMKSSSSKVFRPENPQYHTYAIYSYQNLMHKVIVHGMAHAWSGGNPTMPRNDAYGPDASMMILNFFGMSY